MMKKNKYFIFAIFIFICFFLFSGYAFAYEVLDKFPAVPGLPSIKNMDPENPDLSTFAGYFFGLGIYLAGILALISFAIGAIELVASGDSPDRRSDAIDRMRGAILGLILTVVSGVLIRTINDSIASTALTSLEGGIGVYYTNGKYQQPVNQEVSDTSSRPKGYDQIRYCCNSNCSGGSGQPLLIWEFPRPGLEAGNGDLSQVRLIRKNCGETESVSGIGSFRTDFEKPGVYYFLNGGCQGYASSAIIGSVEQILSPFNKRIRSVKIVNDPKNNIYYGAIFHEVGGLKNGGKCSNPVWKDGCNNIDLSWASAADIFLINKASPTTSGDGVSFYSEPFGWNADSEGAYSAGYYDIDAKDIQSAINILAPNMCFDYYFIDQPEQYMHKCTHPNGDKCNIGEYGCQDDSYCYEGEICKKENNGAGNCVDAETGQDLCSPNACETFQDCPGSIQIKGSYLVAIYSKGRDDQGRNFDYCQTFLKDVENLRTQPYKAQTAKEIDDVEIIPIQ
jgi:hypothetical protein